MLDEMRAVLDEIGVAGLVVVFSFLRFCVTGLIFLLIAEDWIRGKVVKKQSAVVCGSRDGSVASPPAPRPCLHLLRKSFCMMSVVRSIASSWRPGALSGAGVLYVSAACICCVCVGSFVVRRVWARSIVGG